MILKETVLHGNLLFPCSVHKTVKSGSDEIMLYTHFHEEAEILYIALGKMRLTVDSVPMDVNEGDAVYLAPNVIHGAVKIDNSSCEFYALVFLPAFVNSSYQDLIQQDYLDSVFSKPFLLLKQKEILPIIREVIDAYDTKAFGYELLIKVLILKLLFHASHQAARIGQKQTGKDNLTKARMKTILAYLETHYETAFTLGDWAATAELSKEQFSRIFKKQFNKTPMDYLTRYRVSKAAEALIHSNRPVIDIAFECGFDSASYFGAVFKKETGFSPLEFRKKYQHKVC